MQRIVYYTIVALLLAGCATNVKRNSCIDKNWNQIGYATAVAGKSVRTFDTYSDQCMERLGDNEKKSYVDGFTRGIIEYCTYDNGYNLGVANKTLADVCPVELRGPFNKGFNLGKLEFDEKMRRMDTMSEQAERSQKMQEQFSRDKQGNQSGR